MLLGVPCLIIALLCLQVVTIPEQEPSKSSPVCVITRSGSGRLAEGALSMPQAVNTPIRDVIEPDNTLPPEVSLAEFF